MRYNWQHPDWPNFQYDLDKLQPFLWQYAKNVGKIYGSIRAMGPDIQQAEVIEIMVNEALTTSKIESIDFNPDDIRSSMLKLLNISDGNTTKVNDSKADGLAKLMIDLQNNFKENLSLDVLYNWHRFLFAETKFDINIGGFRSTLQPMQIVSGPIGKETVFFEAPPSNVVYEEMLNFIAWFNQDTQAKLPGPIKAGIAHLYFETIHPFEDGNGRIGRAISYKTLSQDLGYPCTYSLSQEILVTKKEYYNQLHQASAFTMDITAWLEYFIKVLCLAQEKTDKNIQFLIEKREFFKKYENQLNARQKKLVKKIFAIGPLNFEGAINARKYASLNSCSKATATRDLIEMLTIGALKKSDALGRSTSYALNRKTNDNCAS